MTETGENRSREGLAKILIEHKLVSEAQVDLAVADQEITGLAFDEVVLLRGWVDKETLFRVAPWLNEGQNPTDENSESNASIGTTYQENLKVYRGLIEKILGKKWD